MKISLQWLKKYVDLDGISVKTIESKLTMAGLEVENVVDGNAKFENFVVGLVKKKEKHPDADKLSLCIVNDGENDFQVVCGAPNVEEGQKIPFAKVGALIPKGNFKLKKVKIRGVESYGMICAEDELELGEDHEGIMVLDDSLIPGTPIAKALQLDDVIFEIGITPNRPDALSHIGVARDLAALFDKELKTPELKLEEISTPASTVAKVIIDDSQNCPRYSARVVKNVTVQESPDWLKRCLQSIGLRPINNIVDVTNFILHEIGQPLHAFDLNHLNDNTIIVRSTDKEESFTTLDSKERKLSKGTLLICDSKNPVAIAGVMGGENSEIIPETKDILIESAYFNPSSVRKTSKVLGLSTDSSYRFERGTDSSITAFAASRAAELIVEISGGEILAGVIDAYPNEIEKKKVSVRHKRVAKVLGFEISVDEINKIVNNLGMEIISSDKEKTEVYIPTFRPDIEREIDVIEELARIYGYDNIPAVERIANTLGEKVDQSEFAEKIRTAAVSLGLFETITNSLLEEKIANITGSPIKMLNPQSADMAYLRTSLLQGALQCVSKNINTGEKDLTLFEIGKVFNRFNESINSFDDFKEEEHLIISLTGKSEKGEWYSEEKEYDFYDLKGIISSIISYFAIDNLLIDSYYPDVNTIFDYSYSLSFNGKEIGRGGKVNTTVLKVFDIEQDVFSFEFNVTELSSIKADEKRFKEMLKYPKVIRDSAFIVDKTITYNEVIKAIKDGSSSLLKEIKIFDIFESDNLGESKKSLAFSLEYWNESRTLTEDEIEKEFFDMIKHVTKILPAELRGG